jgi:hypothetical protein
LHLLVSLGAVTAMKFQQMSTRHWRIARALAVALLCVLIPLILSGTIADWTHRRAFDADLWKKRDQTAHHSDWPPRLCMVDDLLARGRLKAMTESQVIDLLGPPDSKSLGFSFYLGPERGFMSIDSEILVIEFGTDGKVSRQRIHRD